MSRLEESLERGDSVGTLARMAAERGASPALTARMVVDTRYCRSSCHVMIIAYCMSCVIAMLQSSFGTLMDKSPLILIQNAGIIILMCGTMALWQRR